MVSEVVARVRVPRPRATRPRAAGLRALRLCARAGERVGERREQPAAAAQRVCRRLLGQAVEVVVHELQRHDRLHRPCALRARGERGERRGHLCVEALILQLGQRDPAQSGVWNRPCAVLPAPELRARQRRHAPPVAGVRHRQGEAGATRRAQTWGIRARQTGATHRAQTWGIRARRTIRGSP